MAKKAWVLRTTTTSTRKKKKKPKDELYITITISHYVIQILNTTCQYTSIMKSNSAAKLSQKLIMIHVYVNTDVQNLAIYKLILKADYCNIVI